MVDQVSMPTDSGRNYYFTGSYSFDFRSGFGRYCGFCKWRACADGGRWRFRGSEMMRIRPNASGKGEYITEVAVLADFAEHVSELTDVAIEKAKARAEELKKLMENKDMLTLNILKRNWNALSPA